MTELGHETPAQVVPASQEQAQAVWGPGLPLPSDGSSTEIGATLCHGPITGKCFKKLQSAGD